MNLFWLDTDPVRAAQAHHDVHVRKMLLEVPSPVPTHLNHPCASWTRASRGNFDAAIALCQALAAEYRYRFDKVHASEAALAWVIRHRGAA